MNACERAGSPRRIPDLDLPAARLVRWRADRPQTALSTAKEGTSHAEVANQQPDGVVYRIAFADGAQVELDAGTPVSDGATFTIQLDVCTSARGECGQTVRLSRDPPDP